MTTRVRTREADLTLEALHHAAQRLLDETTDTGWPPHDVARANLRSLINGRLTPAEYLAATGGR